MHDRRTIWPSGKLYRVSVRALIFVYPDPHRGNFYVRELSDDL